jgi:signal peptidase I
MTDYQNHQPGPVVLQPVEPSLTSPTPQKHERFGGLLSTVAVLLIAPLVAFFLTSFVFQSYQVDGPSMQTTLQNSDRLLVWKLPKTWARITGSQFTPNRGDVVIFVERNLPDINEPAGKQLIKRVIGLPGERVVVRDGAVTVYNNENPQGFDPDKTLPYGKEIPETPIDVDTVVPEGHIFVMGDNRPDSLDSRSASIGPVNLDDVVGKLVIRVWPITNAKVF